ncbi:hypothetical protein ACFLZH_05420 [Patescibacteria group bacterium]
MGVRKNKGLSSKEALMKSQGQGHSEFEELAEDETGKKIEDLAWSINFAKQTPDPIKEKVLLVLKILKQSEENENENP